MMLSHKKQRGSVLLVVLMLGLVGVLILIASIRVLVVTYRRSTEQVQVAQATSAAESGVMYAIWLLNVVKVDVNDLPEVVDKPIEAAPFDEEVANFTLTYAVDQVGGKSRVNLISEGRDAVRADIKETIRATLLETEPTMFTITSWQHDL